MQCPAGVQPPGTTAPAFVRSTLPLLPGTAQPGCSARTDLLLKLPTSRDCSSSCSSCHAYALYAPVILSLYAPFGSPLQPHVCFSCTVPCSKTTTPAFVLMLYVPSTSSTAVLDCCSYVRACRVCVHLHVLRHLE